MNKKELVNAVAEAMGSSKKDASFALDTVIDVIYDAVRKGEKVSLVGFGSFEPVMRKGRTCKNFQTGEPIEVPAKMAPRFKPAKRFKELVAELPVTE
jgi:DNA-binding protein HU-beta